MRLPVTPATSVAPAEWLKRSLRPWGEEGTTVDSFIPAGYDAFGRIRKTDGVELSAEQALRLIRILVDHDPSGRIYFALWDGYGIPGRTGHGMGDEAPSIPRLELPGRTYLLFEGSPADVERFNWNGHYLAPDIWWPDHQRWCVSSDTDLAHVYVGGSEGGVQALFDAGLPVESMSARFRIDLDPRAGA